MSLITGRMRRDGEKFMRCFHDGSLRGGHSAPARAARGDQLMISRRPELRVSDRVDRTRVTTGEERRGW